MAAEGADPNAFHLSWGKFHLTISLDVLEKFLLWAEHNPLLFLATLLFAAWCILQWRLSARDKAKLKEEFNDKRLSAKDRSISVEHDEPQQRLTGPEEHDVG